MKRLIILLFTIQAFLLQLFATDIKTSQCKNANIASETELFIDKTNLITIDDIFLRKKSLPFKPNDREAIYLGYNYSTYWASISLTNSENFDQQIFLEFDNPTIDHLRLYVCRDSMITIGKPVGDLYPFNNRILKSESLYFSIAISAKETIHCFAEIKPNGDAAVIPITLLDTPRFLKQETRKMMSTGIFIGILLLVIIATLFSLLTGFFSNEYYYFLGFATVSTIFVLNYIGFNFHYFWPNSPSFNYNISAILPHFICFCLLRFTLLFYNLKENHPKLYKSGKYSSIAILVFAPVQLLEISYLLQIFILLSIILSVATFCASVSIFVMKDQLRRATFYLIAFIPFMITNTYMTALASGAMFKFNYTDPVLKWGLGLQVLILYFGVFDKLRREKEESKRKLIDNQQRYKCLLENSNEAIFVLRNAKVIFSNDHFHRITDATVLNNNNGNFGKMLDFESANDFLNKIESVLETHKSIEPYRILSQSGIWYKISIVYIVWDGKPACQCFMSDITSAVLKEEENIDLEKKLLASKQMESIGTLAGGIAHDFNNILTPIIGYTEMALEEVDKNSGVHSDLQNISISAQRAKNLVQQILHFSKNDEIEKKIVPIASIVKEVHKMIACNLDSKISIKVNNEFPNAQVYMNPAQLHQIVMNIATNAVQAIGDEQGSIDINIQRHSVTTSSARTYTQKLKPGEYVLMTIKDSGQGMTDTVKQRLFEPFYTTKNTGKGTGLGLSVVYGILTNAGGGIDIDSKLGYGATFTVYLPIHKGTNEPATKQVKIPHNTGSGTILIVDDETDITEMLSRQFKKNGYRVVAFNSSVQALNYVKSEQECFDIAIVDLTMPNMTGVELVKEFEKLRPEMPTIIMSGYFQGLLSETESLGQSCHLEDKPIDFQQLCAKVASLLLAKEKSVAL